MRAVHMRTIRRDASYWPAFAKLVTAVSTIGALAWWWVG